MRKVYRLAAAVVVVASLAAGTSGCKPGCQNSVQSNGPNEVNIKCDK